MDGGEEGGGEEGSGEEGSGEVNKSSGLIVSSLECSLSDTSPASSYFS